MSSTYREHLDLLSDSEYWEIIEQDWQNMAENHYANEIWHVKDVNTVSWKKVCGSCLQ